MTLSLLAMLTYAQTEGLMADQVHKLKDPESPAEASLGQFGGGNISSFAGVPNISIPVYEIKLKGLTFPIELRYDNTGVKVNSEATWVGLGWTLDAGGVITRAKRGLPDDVRWEHPIPITESGFLLDHGQVAEQFSDVGLTDDGFRKKFAVMDGMLSEPSPGEYWFPVDVRAKKTDTEPDLFQFRFAGRSGKFVFGTDQKAKLFNYEPWKIDYVLDPTGDPSWPGTYQGQPELSKGITSFTILDESGNKFIFSEIEKSRPTTQGGYRIRTNCDMDPDASNIVSTFVYTSAWYLTRIETVIGEAVTFTYVDEPLKAYQFEESERNSNLTYNDGISHYGRISTISEVTAKRLSIIETPYETITFVPGSGRLDLPTSKLLSDLQVVSKPNNKLIKQVHFVYDYFSSPVNPTSDGVHVSNYYADAYHRLKLTSIRTAVPGDEYVNKYNFFYNEQQPLPGKFSNQQDFWGYYNGNNATHAFPKIYISTSLNGPDRFSVLQLKDLSDPQYFVLDGANRNCNPATVALGTLNKIVYPTGGSTTYEYEPHDFLYRGRKFSGGGIRVRTITDYDGVSHNHDIVKTYDYIQSVDPTKTSGVLFDLPIFAYKENNCSVVFAPITTKDPIDYAANTLLNFQKNTVRMDNPASIKGFGDGITVGYSEIRESISNSGYTWSKFSVPVKYGDANDILNNGCSIASNGYCDGLFSVPAIKTGLTATTWLPGFEVITHPDFTMQDMSANSYPFLPNSNYDWNRGLLLSKTIYDNTNQPKQKNEYQYNLILPETGTNMVTGLYRSRGNNFNLKDLGSSQTEITTQSFYYYNKYKIITNVNKLPASVTQTDYLPGGQVIKNINYTYSKGKFIKEQSSTNSDGNLQKTSYRYPFDYSTRTEYLPQPQNAVTYLVQKNMISSPLETVTSITRNGTETITAAKTNMVTATFDGYIVPVNEMHLEIASPIPKNQYQPANIDWDETAETPSIDPQMVSAIYFNKYDGKTNLTEYQDKTGSKKSIIWGYDKRYQIAAVSGAARSDVFHENFEEFTGTGLSNAQDSKTGIYSKTNGYTQALTGLSNNTYTLTYWKKGNGKWEFVKLGNIIVSNNTYTITISGTIQVDDICFYPLDAQITTSTYDPLVGQTSMTNAKGETTYYEYDAFQRLVNIKDQDGNIIKHTDYHYQGQ